MARVLWRLGKYILRKEGEKVQRDIIEDWFPIVDPAWSFRSVSPGLNFEEALEDGRANGAIVAGTGSHFRPLFGCFSDHGQEGAS